MMASKTILCLLLSLIGVAAADDRLPKQYLPATAYVVPKETAPDGEGYFSIIEGHNRRLYVGTHANGLNSWLVEFDPPTGKMRVVVDAQRAIGTDLKGFGSQAKIHTRNNTGKLSGRIYFGTKQGYPSRDETREDYPGGYPMIYDPKTGQTKVYPIPVLHQGINSIAPDESRRVAYVSTCSDHRPGPGENAVFLRLDLETGEYRELIDTEHVYGFIVIDSLGRAYHPVLGGDIARFNPQTDQLERLTQMIDGRPPTAESRLALTPRPDPINWDISPDGTTLFAQAMSGNALFTYDLTSEGNVLTGRKLGTLIPGATDTDCRALCVGPFGTAWCALTENVNGIHMLHIVRYGPGDAAPVDLGVVEVVNPDFTEFNDADGKALPFHGGFTKLPNGKTVTRNVILGVCESHNGNVYVLALSPFSVLEIQAKNVLAHVRGT